MKQLLQLTCFALPVAFAGSATAATTLYALNFDGLGDPANAYNNTGSGTTAVTNTGGFNNYNASTQDGSDWSHSPHGGTFSIKDAAGIGVNTTDGFDISLDFRREDGNGHWADLFSFTVNGHALKFEKQGNTGDFKFYNDGTLSSLNDYTIPFSLAGDTWATMRINFKEQTAGTTTISFYKDGVFEGSTTSTQLVGNLTEVRGGANNQNGTASGAWLMDNFTVAVPEPSSTALLGLGGLALILRRRK